MEKSTSNTFLMYSETENGEFKNLVNIRSYPDIFSPPEKLDVSDLSSNQKKYEPGMVDVPDQDFGYIYNKPDYDKIRALKDTPLYFQLRFGKNGEYGCWKWHGKVFTTPSGGGVGDPREAKLITYPDSDIEEVTVTAGK